jgi:hypothetical protein
MRLRLRFLGVLPPAMLVADALRFGASVDDRREADEREKPEPVDHRAA